MVSELVLFCLFPGISLVFEVGSSYLPISSTLEDDMVVNCSRHGVLVKIYALRLVIDTMFGNNCRRVVLCIWMIE